MTLFYMLENPQMVSLVEEQLNFAIYSCILSV